MTGRVRTELVAMQSKRSGNYLPVPVAGLIESVRAVGWRLEGALLNYRGKCTS